jgi:hypothetical protein
MRARVAAWYTSSFTIGASLSFLRALAGMYMPGLRVVIAWAALPRADPEIATAPRPVPADSADAAGSTSGPRQPREAIGAPFFAADAVVDEASPPEGLPDRAGSIDGLSGATSGSSRSGRDRAFAAAHVDPWQDLKASRAIPDRRSLARGRRHPGGRDHERTLTPFRWIFCTPTADFFSDFGHRADWGESRRGRGQVYRGSAAVFRLMSSLLAVARMRPKKNA